MRGKLLLVFLATTLAIAFAFGDSASAARRKLTYDQAYAKCKAELDKARLAGHTERYTVGAGCMKKYGYRL